jgi:asparagine synthase (glutamine-hydrolysing)
MCGIAGILARDGAAPPHDRDVRAMLATLVHRGPDDEGVHVDGPLGFGTRRLAIIDVQGGHQPLSNAGGGIWVALNGEIYNYRELAAELRGEGYAVRTQSDTETIALLYERDGDDFLRHLNGMFALAVWDAGRRRLLLARDRVGIKPLYYAADRRGLVFGSELKAVLAARPGSPPELDLEAARDYLSLFYVPGPSAIVKGVQKLQPGHLLIADGAGVKDVRAYWSVPAPAPRQRAIEDETAEFAALFEDAVRLQMRSDVPYGAFLSGGIDSSAVVGTMAGLAATPVRTFAIGFEGSARYDELSHARAVAQRFHTEHEEFVVRPDVFGLVAKMVHYFDEPFADAAFLPTYVLSEMSRRKVTVVLTGDGGDEIFAGYDRYRSEVLAKWASRIPGLVRRGTLGPLLAAYRGPAQWRLSDLVRQARKKSALLDLPPSQRYARHFERFSATDLTALAGPALRGLPVSGVSARFAAILEEPGSADFLTRRMALDVRTWLPDQMLTKVDRATMAHGLEARVPFLDHRVVEFAMGLSDQAKFTILSLKRFLKRAFAGLLPPEILHRRKHGFEVPVDEWLRGPLRGMARDVLAGPALRRHGLVDPAFVARMLDEHERAVRNWSGEIFAVLVFQLWYDRWMTGGGAAAPAQTASDA